MAPIHKHGLASSLPTLRLVVYVMAMTLSTSSWCGATFMLPDPSSSSLANGGTVTCQDGGGGGAGCVTTMNVTTCTTLKVCTLTCPTRTDFPDSQTPITSPAWSRSSNDTGCQLSTQTPQGGPASADKDNGLLEVNSSSTDCAVSIKNASTTSGRLGLSMWILPACTSNCTVARIGGNNLRVYINNGKLCVNDYCGTDAITTWTHLVFQVMESTVTYAVNGALSSSGGQSISVPTLPDPLAVVLGVSSNADIAAGDSYQLYDVRYFNDVLTFREIQMINTNSALGDAGEMTECRCPYSHLTVSPGDFYTCQNDTGGEVRRVVPVLYAPDTLLDGDTDSAWAGPDNGGQFTLTVQLKDEYQLEKVEVGIVSSFAGTLTLVLSDSESQSLQCANLVCSMDLSLSLQNVSVEMLESRIKQQFNLSYTPPAQQTGQPVVLTSIAVTGRCNCNGNAGQCNMSVTPYVCDCEASTNTVGNRCQTCQANRFHLLGQFACQGSCDCEPSGVLDPQQTCDVNGGACQCKPNVYGDRCDVCKPWTFNFTASNPHGCQDCTCHQNGSLECNKQTGSCTCKTHVASPLCNECRNGFYDAGPLEGPDLCRACGCDSRGIFTGQVCDKESGLCPCKEFVQGSTCNECKDEYYNLQVSQSKGCLPCECHSVGSINNTCHKVTGQCTCKGGLSTGDKCAPRIDSVEPRYGPMFGGTRVTIRGQLLGDSSQLPSVFLGTYRQTLQQHNITTIIVETLNYNRTDTVPVKVSWPSDPYDLPTGNFTFKPDPRLDTNMIPDVSMYTSGGCGVVFKGANFNSVAVPKISVTDTTSGNTAHSSCRHVQQDLQCITPDLTNLGLGPSNLRFGLELDGLKHRDLGDVTVFQDPKLGDLGSHNFQYPFETTITISGSGLTGGCSESEVSVLIGVVNCDIVGFSSTHLECSPPKALRGSSDMPVMVRIGSHISKRVGTLNYLEFYETTYFIGIMCGVGALIILIITLVIFCRCRRRRQNRKAANRNSHMRLVEKPSNGAAAVSQDRYTEFPQGGTGFVNNGYQSPIQQETVIREHPKNAPLPTANEVDLMTDFLNRVEPSLWDPIKSATVSCNDLKRGNICTNSGKFARVIDGHFSTVKAGHTHETKVTIKTLKEPLPGDSMLPLWATAALRECLRLHRHGTDNVLSIMGVALDKERFHLVYPYMQNRTLKDHIIDANKEFSVRQLVEYGLQVADGLVYLNTKDVVHRDLATRNCWVDANMVVKIADAAFAWDFYGQEYVYDGARERYIPLRWMAPESLADGYYDMRTDVWSLGVLLWELLTRGCLPFHEVGDGSVKDCVIEGYRLGKPDNCSDNLYELMKECWNAENEHRPHISTMFKLLDEELRGEALQQDDIYVNLGSEDYYENEQTLSKARRPAPLPPART